MSDLRERPRVVVIAGPNGAGKSTAAAILLRGSLGVSTFVNADIIARGLCAFRPESVAVEAGAIMLRRLGALADRRESFAFETTLAARSFAPWLRTLTASGYAFHLVFLWLPSAETAVARVAERVSRGGHHVPEAVVRTRYARGLANFFRLYRAISIDWRLYDNSEPSTPRPVACGCGERIVDVFEPHLWAGICKEFTHETH